MMNGMKKAVLALVCACFSLPVFGELAIRDLKVQQRWPWNGLVDITYSVVCDIKNVDKTPVDVHISFAGFDQDRNQAVQMKTLTGDGANGIVHAGGPYKLTWNVTKDDPAFNSSSFKVKVKAFTKAKPLDAAGKTSAK